MTIHPAVFVVLQVCIALIVFGFVLDLVMTMVKLIALCLMGYPPGEAWEEVVNDSIKENKS